MSQPGGSDDDVFIVESKFSAGKCPVCKEASANTPLGCGHRFCLLCILRRVEVENQKCPQFRKAFDHT